MTWGAVAVAGATLVGGAMASDAAGSAADAQTASAQAGIDQQNKRNADVQRLLSPYVQAGVGNPNGTFDAEAYLKANPDVAANSYWASRPEDHYLQHGMAEGRARPIIAGSISKGGSLQAQQDLLGLNGTQAQQAAIGGISGSPLFSEMQKQGENAILANASATGGLRGGNTQGALAQFRPQLLNQLIDQQYQRLGGITSLSQNAAAGVGNAGMTTGNQITALLGQQGAAQAGAALAGGRANAQMVNGVASGFGQYVGNGGTFGGSPGPQIGGAAGSFGGATSFGVEPGGSFGSLGSGFYGIGNS